MSWIVTIVTFVLNLFLNRKRDAAADATQSGNDIGRAAAEVANAAEKEAESEISNLQRQACRDSAAVRSAGSLQQQNGITANAIDNANGPLR